MAKALKIIGIVAGAIALVATGLGAVGVASIFGASTSAIAGIAGAVAGIASAGSALLTKPPPARGSVTQLVISPDAPQPYVMGEGLMAGVLRYQRSYGATLDKIPNPYRFMTVVYSGGGPVQSISPRVDQGTIGSWYSGFLYTQTRLGATPDTALTPQWAGAPGWDANSKLSGKAAIGWSLKFDKKGKVFASGMPQLGAYGQWVKVYDPRLDSTRAGGSGTHRINDETTWQWSQNPALHAATYAYGRHQNGKRTFGIGLPDDAIDWGNVSAWANVCDANGWHLFGVIWEPGDRWNNLRDICAAGGAEPVLTASTLHFHYAAPRLSLDTVTIADLLDEEDQSIGAQASWRDRLNTIVPKYRDPLQNWELVQAEAVQVASYLSEDGEVKQAEWPFNLVKDVDQAAQLSRYRLEDSRELQPIELTCGQRMKAYRPGDCLDLDLLEHLGIEGPAVILRREFDPEKLAVKLTLIGETAGKHAFALGETGVPPATPALGQTGQQRDELLAATLGDIGVAVEVVADRTVPADYTGAVSAANLDAVIWSPRVLQSGVTIKIDDDTSYALSNAAGGTFAVDNTIASASKGDVTISAITANTASADLTITVAGVDQPRITLRVTKQLGPPPSGGSSGAYPKIVQWAGGDFSGINTVSYAAVVPVKTVTLASGESLYGTAPLDYFVSGTTLATRTMTFKWQYSAAGANSWNDFGTGITGTTATSAYSSGAPDYEYHDPEPGSVAVTQSAAPTPGDYDVRLVAVCSTTGRLCTPSGTATIEAKV
jgi:hypothetical protein